MRRPNIGYLPRFIAVRTARLAHMPIAYKISWLVVCTALLAAIALALIGYSTARKQYLAGIDRQLNAAAAALPRVISDHYLDRALGHDQLTNDEYVAMVKSLSELADQSKVYYLYAFAQRGTGVDSQIVHLATSASAAERDAGDWSAYLDPYEQPPASLLQTFADGQTRFTEYADEFGEFRSIFVRHFASGADGGQGEPYVIGVDVSLGKINRDLAGLVMRYLAVGAIVALVAGVVGVILARRIARPLLELSHEVEAWSARDFARDDAIRAHIQQLANAHRDETGELARRFVDVQDRLQTYLLELTETTAAKQKIENQLEIAKSIQEGLLPAEAPVIENFQVQGWSQPADQTGGDYFDWMELPNGRVMFTIGDVTGHGIGPALVTAASRAYARATANSEDALDATVARLNDLLHGDLKGERFVTLVACLLDPKARQMKLVAAGHGPVMFYSKRLDKVQVTIDTHGLPLGIVDHSEYERAMDLTFEPGDALILVSDGFFEWMNADGETFGTERLAESILNSCRAEPENVIDRLRNDVAAFNGGTSQADDTTALVIRCVS